MQYISPEKIFLKKIKIFFIYYIIYVIIITQKKKSKIKIQYVNEVYQ